MKTSILVCFGAAMLFACSDDNSNNAADGPVAADAPSGGGADAPAPKVFNVTLTKAGEPQPCTNNPGASAMGSGTVTINGAGASATVVVSNLTFTGLSGAATLGHIHFGTSTTPSGPIVLNFGANPTSPVNKTFSAADYMANAGAPADFATFISMARAGNNAYVNIHTSNCPGGEIRGELQ